MSFSCTPSGHTWVPETRSPSVRWNTTKDGQVLNPAGAEQASQNHDVDRRCGRKRRDGERRQDGDGRTVVAGGGSGDDEE